MIKKQNIPMVDLKGQYQKIKSEVDLAVSEVLNSCYYIGGPWIKNFATNLEEFLGVNHVIPWGNGTDALQIALMALGLKPGDEVITTSFTFVATAEVIAVLGLVPVFVDVHPDTFNIDENKIEAAITEKTKCIIPVHLFGQGANMEKIMEIANRRNVYVVEDNAQAIGCDFTFSDGKVQKLGTIGHIGTTSFYPAKNLGAAGDGGAIFTNDEKLAQSLKMICNHGSEKRYYHKEIGVNSRLDSIQAAILDVKLKHLPDYIRARQKAAAYYTSKFKGVSGIQTPVTNSYSTHVFHQYTLIIDRDRDTLKEKLTDEGISSYVYYPVPLHLQEAYKNYPFSPNSLPNTENLAKKVLSIPMHTELTEQLQDYIVSQIVQHQ